MCNLAIPKVKLPIPGLPSFTPPKMPVFAIDLDLDVNLDLPRLRLPIPGLPSFQLPRLIVFLIALAITLSLKLPRLNLPFPGFSLPSFTPKIPVFVVPCPFD